MILIRQFTKNKSPISRFEKPGFDDQTIITPMAIAVYKQLKIA